MNPGGKRGGKPAAPVGALRPGVTRTIKRGQPSGTMSTIPYQGMTRGDIQGVKEALAIRYGRPDPAVDAVRRRQGGSTPGGIKDSAFQSVARLKGAQPISSGGGSDRQAVLIPAKLMTPARRKKLGITSFSGRSESAGWRAQQQPNGDWVVSQRSGR
jgi:hypothetical protein